MAETSLREKVPSLVAGAITTVVVSYGLSYLPGGWGTGSTVFGLAFGSITTGTVNALTEKGIRKSTAAVKKIRKKPGETESEFQTRVIAAIIPEEKTVIRWDKFRQRLPWVIAFSLLALGVTFGGVTMVQALSRRPLTVTSVARPAPRPRVTVTKTVAPAPVLTSPPAVPSSTPTVTPTPTPTVSLPLTPTVTPSASPSVSVTAPAGASPTSTPLPTPTVSPAPSASSPQFPQGG
jgi:hypothetical protein